jgi:hypothetical protein
MVAREQSQQDPNLVLAVKVRNPKTTYKDKLRNRYDSYANTISAVEGNLKTKLDAYYQALSGEYAYTDTHTGKTVKARTYKKRMEFAQKTLDEIESSLSTISGDINDFEAESLRKVTRDLYNTAIRDNVYLKRRQEAQPYTRAKQNLSLKLSSLEERIAQSYEHVPRPEPAPYKVAAMKSSHEPSVSAPAPAPEPERKTSSPLLNKLNEVDAQREAENSQKLWSDAPVVWPTPRKVGFEWDNIERWVKGGIVAGLIGMTSYFGYQVHQKFYGETIAETTQSIENTLSQMPQASAEPSPFITGANSLVTEVEKPATLDERIQEKVPAPLVKQSAPVLTKRYLIPDNLDLVESSRKETPYEFKAEVLFSVPHNYALINQEMQQRIAKEKEKEIRAKNELARQLAINRVQKAMAQMEHERKIKAEAIKQSPILLTEAEKHPGKVQEEVKLSKLPSARDVLLSIWERRSNERKQREGMVVVKEVTYHPDGRIVTYIPGKSATTEYASNSEQ